MERIIVSLSRRGEERELDLEIPADLPAGVLIREIAMALGWDEQGEIYADPPGRVLHPREALAQAGAWDGARLLFQEGGGYAGPPQPPPPPGEGEGPIRRWRPLDLGQPPVSPAPSASDISPPPSSGGFVWKQIDED